MFTSDQEHSSVATNANQRPGYTILGTHLCSSKRHHEEGISFKPDRLLEQFHTILVQATVAAKRQQRAQAGVPQGLLEGGDRRAAYWTWIKGKSFEKKAKSVFKNKTNNPS